MKENDNSDTMYVKSESHRVYKGHDLVMHGDGWVAYKKGIAVARALTLAKLKQMIADNGRRS